ncbi:hypothetical protein PIB30_067380 [Stylosanthes scabra]|uniref:Uncharacterized protein n=1 Tax=Stylosanthes scabra TaxID=79078 RepID=A0ABU6WN75_9FABA|nr:hypothetical protein [Stylosanthes scabra]
MCRGVHFEQRNLGGCASLLLSWAYHRIVPCRPLGDFDEPRFPLVEGSPHTQVAYVRSSSPLARLLLLLLLRHPPPPPEAKPSAHCQHHHYQNHCQVDKHVWLDLQPRIHRDYTPHPPLVGLKMGRNHRYSPRAVGSDLAITA